ncbi:MAG: DUF928 domain-containing protein [Oscillatoriophycideae cyanobacterium NC_groundwater_1537_Pr4_S-0.65um_50_18]|nr:DUF928 domain-containing protein [Oscillatoriophycideae cyanobacterium NC_groundwater_1537_Pr4_S-0.65um_50_18]
MERLLLSGTLGVLALLLGMVGVQTEAAHATSFKPPADNSLPRSSTGGASRGGFIPPADNSLPRSSTGGASRGAFMPPTDNSVPQASTGGASRGAFTPSPDNAAPRTAAGGASRTNLYGYLPQSGDQAVPMLAVTPQNFYGTTLAERPTILVYVPSSNAQDAVFSLKDDVGNTIYQTIVAVPNNAGVVAVQLPEEAPALEVGKDYQWFFALMIDGTLSPSTPYVDAWIKRIQPTAELTQALQQGDAQQRADILAEKGVWYDSAAMLTDLRMAQPTNTALTEDWHELLNSVGLEEVTAAY